MRELSRLSSFIVGAYFTVCSFIIVQAQNTSSLPGKIAVDYGDSLFIYNNSSTRNLKVKLKNDEKTKYGAFTWVNRSNSFLGIEYFQTSSSGINQGNIACFDLSGNLGERIYEAADGEIAWHLYLSRNDKWLLFTTIKKGNVATNPFEGLNPAQSLMIMNFRKKKIIKKIENFGTALGLEIHESPWLYDEDRFIYSISKERKIEIEGSNVTSNYPAEQLGVYIFDLVTGQRKLLIPHARYGVCSPVDLRISYLKDDGIWILDLKVNSTKKIIDFGSKNRIVNLHWTPDGKFIYVAYFRNYQNDESEPEEVLININTSKESSFKKIGHGFQPYTWK